MRPEFVEQVKVLRKKIFKKVKPKTVMGKNINGDMLIEICEAYVTAINTGNSPNIENAWTYVCKSETNKAMEYCIKQFSTALDKVAEPLELESLEKLKAQVHIYIIYFLRFVLCIYIYI